MEDDADDEQRFLAELTELINKHDIESEDLIAIYDQIKIKKPSCPYIRGLDEYLFTNEIPPSKLSHATSKPSNIPNTLFIDKEIPLKQSRNLKQAKTMMEDTVCLMASNDCELTQIDEEFQNQSQINPIGGKIEEKLLELNKTKELSVPELKLLPIIDSNRKLKNNVNVERSSKEVKIMYTNKKTKKMFNFEDFITRQKRHEINKRQKQELLANVLAETLPSKANGLPLKCVKIRNKRQNAVKFDELQVTEVKSTSKPCASSFSRNRAKGAPKEIFTPISVKPKEYQKVKSKLQIQASLNTLIKRINEQKEVKERSISIERCRKETEEEIEWIHKSKTTYRKSNTQRNSSKNRYIPVCVKFKS